MIENGSRRRLFSRSAEVVSEPQLKPAVFYQSDIATVPLFTHSDYGHVDEPECDDLRIGFECNKLTGPFPYGRLEVRVVAEDDGRSDSSSISFSVPPDFFVHGDRLAAVLAALCAPVHRQIEFHFPISEDCRSYLSRHRGVEVKAAGSVSPRHPGDGIGLNFSGGYDSLAAYLLSPEKVQLISTDFGERFRRERDYFETFETTVCKTDFREKGYASFDWRFMAAASILYADYLRLGTIGFGTILEASPWNLARRRATAAAAPDSLFKAAGLKSFSPIRGLTEFGTAMIIHQRAVHEAEKSLASVADPGTEKLFRKRLLIDTARYLDVGVRPEFSSYNLPRQKVTFGSSFAVDFLTLYFVRLYGVEEVSAWVDGLEALGLKWLGKTTLNFYVRYNTSFLPEIPRRLLPEILAGYHDCGLLPYTEADWEEFREVRSFLGQFHDIPG